ncbi:colicin immunity domain-containing protein [Domibacillus sp. DTU_2020_1001157_1_SI_ALB_TIR_016]|uniref:colicin immunity domain-containing protein n=1 Tax=Domibacillus sp. DTU_2020_1001157_1_SI_ALB_TIR_016 TaxID=3077789 RepID=UPI0028EACA4B|nr:colicin immunity domain-containing protein [Domibacillus sp. DTU_2020_1001157_1_SI_ALB_TIR_016]WNS80194.1 colicin immunity domain-containing protein [Domibacillus sp. DTU_2020_1001157_1_SI_ALB_TIR_016]
MKVLICQHLSLTIEDFEVTYLETFKKETEPMGEEIFRILNNVFESVDCYWHECLPGQETAFEISEQKLREEVYQALTKLTNALNF